MYEQDWREIAQVLYEALRQYRAGVYQSSKCSCAACRQSADKES